MSLIERRNPSSRADRIVVAPLEDTSTFADRAYTAAGALVPRGRPGAVVHEPEAVLARAVRMAREQQVTAESGETVQVRARSLCVHGDTPGAVTHARAVRGALEGAGWSLVGL